MLVNSGISTSGGTAQRLLNESQRDTRNKLEILAKKSMFEIGMRITLKQHNEFTVSFEDGSLSKALEIKVTGDICFKNREATLDSDLLGRINSHLAGINSPKESVDTEPSLTSTVVDIAQLQIDFVGDAHTKKQEKIADIRDLLSSRFEDIMTFLSLDLKKAGDGYLLSGKKFYVTEEGSYSGLTVDKANVLDTALNMMKEFREKCDGDDLFTAVQLDQKQLLDNYSLECKESFRLGFEKKRVSLEDSKLTVVPLYFAIFNIKNSMLRFHFEVQESGRCKVVGNVVDLLRNQGARATNKEVNGDLLLSAFLRKNKLLITTSKTHVEESILKRIAYYQVIGRMNESPFRKSSQSTENNQIFTYKNDYRFKVAESGEITGENDLNSNKNDVITEIINDPTLKKQEDAFFKSKTFGLETCLSGALNTIISNGDDDFRVNGTYLCYKLSDEKDPDTGGYSSIRKYLYYDANGDVQQYSYQYRPGDGSQKHTIRVGNSVAGLSEDQISCNEFLIGHRPIEVVQIHKSEIHESNITNPTIDHDIHQSVLSPITADGIKKYERYAYIASDDRKGVGSHNLVGADGKYKIVSLTEAKHSLFKGHDEIRQPIKGIMRLVVKD